MEEYEVILLAAGQGKRMRASRNKILLHLMGQPVILYSLKTFMADPLCKHIILVTQPDEQDLLSDMLRQARIKNYAITMVDGGCERQYSVFYRHT